MAAITIAERLSEYAANLRFEDLPAAVVHRAKCFFVDSFGCALGGYDSEPVKIARSLAQDVTSRKPARIFCSGETTSLDLAVFANAAMVRYLDFNDGYIGLEAGHPSDNIAGIVTAGEVAKADGKTLIVATVIAYEVFGRMCDTLNIKPMGFDHVTIGAMASVLSIGRVLGLTQPQLLEALNLVVAGNVALYQTRIGNVSMWKGCAYANASRNAVFATQLALRGMTGPSPIFEGRAGYFKAVSQRRFELAPFGGKGGSSFKIMECLIKRYPLGQYSQSVVDAAIQARAAAGDAANIASVEVRTLHTAVSMMAGDPEKWRPANRESADHSMPYTAGIALMYGHIKEEHFDDPYLHDPALLELVSRIKCVVSEEANGREPEAMLCDLDVVLKDGGTKSIRVEYHRGHSKNFMTDAEIEEKFHELADPVLTASRADALAAQLWKLDAIKDVGTVFDLMRV